MESNLRKINNIVVWLLEYRSFDPTLKFLETDDSGRQAENRL